VRGRVAHLVDREVEGTLALPLEEGRGARHGAAARQPARVHRVLVVEHLDLVAAGQQLQHVRRVVGDAAGRGWQRAQEREPHRRAMSAYSWGP
jgi:hypothetical protein